MTNQPLIGHSPCSCCTLHSQEERMTNAPSPKRTLPLLLAGLVFLSCSLPGVASESYVQLEVTSSPTQTSELSTPISPRVDVIQTQPIGPEPLEVTITASEGVVITTTVRDYYEVEVRQGDSLYRIALRECGDARFYKWLAQINGMEETDILRVGQNVKVNCK